MVHSGSFFPQCSRLPHDESLVSLVSSRTLSLMTLRLTWWDPVWKERQPEVSLHHHSTPCEVKRRQHVLSG
ncbi:hypothetical protein HBH70_031830 [Parastagonospora nodorum]|nr:hypothetical protein HBH70_031830 [Parastagonospora nodorum]KAH6036595.1 hypothetical protein HBI54_191240 [Parastagonospora nodorum]